MSKPFEIWKVVLLEALSNPYAHTQEQTGFCTLPVETLIERFCGK